MTSLRTRLRALAVLAAATLLAAACTDQFVTAPAGTGGVGGAGGRAVGGGQVGGDSAQGGGSLEGNGAPCSKDTDCNSGHCPQPEGVCCDTACTGKCMACHSELTEAPTGSCAPVLEDKNPNKECGVPSCSGGNLLEPACNGDGGCISDISECGLYKCVDDPVGCGMTCSNDEACTDEAYCHEGMCIEREQDGEECNGHKQCQSSHCPEQDLICCNTACEGTCQSCDSNKTNMPTGVCAAVTAGTDPDDECPAAQTCNGGNTCTT